MNKKNGLFLFLTISVISVYACDTIKQELKIRDAVFVGKVISLEKICFKEKYSTRCLYLYKVKFQAEAIYKGKIKSDTIEIFTNESSDGMHGFPFKMQTKYIVYSYYRRSFYNDSEGPFVKKKYLFVHDKTKTCEYNEKEIKELNKHRKPKIVKMRESEP